MNRIIAVLLMLTLGSAAIADSVTLTWNPSTDNVGVAGYKVYRDGALIGTTANTTFQDTGLSHNQTYTYTVRSYDSAGNESALSSGVEVTTDYASVACDQTLSVGASVANAVSAAAAGSTICLNSGSWGTVDLFNITKSNYVTVKSTTGQGASGFWRIGNSQFIKLDSVTFSNGGVLINGCSKHIIVSNSAAVVNGYNGLYISQETCPTTVQDITIDGIVLDRQGPSGNEARLGIRSGNTVTVKNSQILGVYATVGGPSDGIQLTGEIHNITIGPNNLFQGMWQSTCDANGGAHCDAIQTYGGPCVNVIINGNMFKDNSTLILNESSCSGEITNNVFQNVTSLQMHEWSPFVFAHNTLYSTSYNINGSSGTPSSGEVKNNIFHSSSYSTDGSTPCTACVASYNLFTSGCSGTNCITGTPTYVGGTPPSTWAGWQLQTGSLGENNGSDGLDRGTLYYGP